MVFKSGEVKMAINASSFKDSNHMYNYEKMSIPEIIFKSEKIDATLAAKEILEWIANNVEKFIDNQRRMFKLDLIVDAEEGSQETLPTVRCLQNLYRAIPEDPVSVNNLEDCSFQSALDAMTEEDSAFMEKIQNCKSILDEVSANIYKAVKEEKDLLQAVFKRMAFYYEIQGVSNGNLLLEELDGEVDVIKFEYEAFPVAVQVTSPKIEKVNEDGTVTRSGGEAINEYVIPEGFTVWIEIAFKAKQKTMSSLF
jgi:hypothetical protein